MGNAATAPPAPPTIDVRIATTLRRGRWSPRARVGRRHNSDENDKGPAVFCRALPRPLLDGGSAWPIGCPVLLNEVCGDDVHLALVLVAKPAVRPRKELGRTLPEAEDVILELADLWHERVG